MNQGKSSLNAHIEKLLRKAPELLDLISAETEKDFDAAFLPYLEKSISDIEKSKTLFQNLSEDGLSSILVMGLSVPGLTVTREAHSNGHVDLTIVADHCSPIRVKLGEAKIYGGFAYHVKGLTQLIGRYSTGREGSGFLIEYFKKGNIKELVQGLRDQMDKKLPLNQTDKSANHTLKWAFSTNHKHSSGETLKVQHIGCNLCSEDVKKTHKSKKVIKK